MIITLLYPIINIMLYYPFCIVLIDNTENIEPSEMLSPTVVLKCIFFVRSLSLYILYYYYGNEPIYYY